MLNPIALYRKTSGKYKLNLPIKGVHIILSWSPENCKQKETQHEAPPLANTPASGSQQATQLSQRAAPPAECHDRKIKSEVKPLDKRAHTQKRFLSIGIPILVDRTGYKQLLSTEKAKLVDTSIIKTLSIHRKGPVDR